MKYVNYVSDLLGKYFVYLVFFTAILAFTFPSIFINIGKTKLIGQSPITLGLATIMFVMGITLNLDDFKVIIARPKDIFVGCLAQFTIMPLLAFTLAKLFKLPNELAIGLVLLGTCPGGTASNVMTYLAKGDIALSIGMTSVSTILAPILTPALTLLLAGQWVKVNVITMFFSILQIVIIPILLGILIHKFLGDRVLKFSKALVIVPILIITLIMGLCIAPNQQNLLNSGFTLIIVVCLHNWFGFLFGYLIGHILLMSPEKKRAISIEVGLQNSGLAVGLSSQFGNPLCALPAAIATVSHQISGALLANIFSGNLKLKFIKQKFKSNISLAK